MRRAILAIILSAMCFTSAWAETDEQRALADEIHAYVMKNVPQYKRLNQMKVMAICIEWDRPTPPRIMVRNVFTTYTDPGSDIQIFPGELRRDAVRRCKGWAAKENAACKCEVLDENEKNKLKVPKNVKKYPGQSRFEDWQERSAAELVIPKEYLEFNAPTLNLVDRLKFISNQTLLRPIRTEDARMLDSSAALAHSLYYYYNVSDEKSKINDRYAKETVKFTCKSSLQNVIKDGAVIHHVYRDGNNVLIREVTVSKDECRF